eukprot:gene7366-11688_t
MSTVDETLIIKSSLPDVKYPEDITLQDYVLGKAAKFGDAPAFIDFDSKFTLTFNQVIGMSDIFAQNLWIQNKFQHKEVVAIFSANHPLCSIVLYGTLKAGGTLTTLNPLYTDREVHKQLLDSQAKYMVTIPQVLDTAKKACADSNVKKIYVMSPDAVETTVSDGIQILDFKNLLAPVKEKVEIKFESNPKEDIAILPYSSGTTGVSKGVMITHTNLVANVAQGEHEGLVISPGEKLIGVLPYFHIYALYAFLAAGLSRGCCTISLPRFDLVKFLTIIQEYKVERVHIVPPIVLALAKHPVIEKFDLSSLKAVVSAAAPLTSALTMECQKRLNVSINQGYGMTESSPLISAQFDNKAIAGGAGVLISNIEARIVDENGKDLGYDNEGELVIRGPNVMKGYLGNEEATKYTIRDGWLFTGDIAKIEKKTNEVFILDRVKELIKYKGFQVPPAELEGLLLGHPAVADCCVIGVQDDEAGELPKAFIVLKPNTKATAEEIMEFIAKDVSPQKKIRLVEFIDAIPKSASGKILRRVLRDKQKESK